MKAAVTILVTRNKGVLDPHAETILKYAKQMGFETLDKIEIGKTFTCVFTADSSEEILQGATSLAETMLCNPIIENHVIAQTLIIEQ